MNTINYIFLGVIFIVGLFFWVYRKFKRNLAGSAERFDKYWNEWWSTPLQVSVYFVAEHYLHEKYGDDYPVKITEWMEARDLNVASSEERIAKLRKLADLNEGKKDRDWEMHYYFVHHCLFVDGPEVLGTKQLLIGGLTSVLKN